MSTIEVFAPALCCNTGVCGEDVDQALVTFSADMDWITRQGGDISRYNLAADPMVFAQNDSVRNFLRLAGSDGLPLVLVDGTTVLTGGYPDRTQLTRWAGLDAGTAPAGAQLLTLTDTTTEADTGTCCTAGTAGATHCC